jgi:hypothetical protein
LVSCKWGVISGAAAVVLVVALADSFQRRLPVPRWLRREGPTVVRLGLVVVEKKDDDDDDARVDRGRDGARCNAAARRSRLPHRCVGRLILLDLPLVRKRAGREGLSSSVV